MKNQILSIIKLTLLLSLIRASGFSVPAQGQIDNPGDNPNDLPPPPEQMPPEANLPPPEALPDMSGQNPPGRVGPPRDVPPPASIGVNNGGSPKAGQAINAAKVGKSNAKVVIEPAGNGNSDKKGAASLPPGQELVNIDFPEPTEIKDIVRAVALWMNKNVILDRNVSGKIQIISPKKVTKEEAYQAFLSALNVLQFTTVETGKVIKIVPIRQAVRGNLRTFMGAKWTPLTDEIITQIVPLKYVDAKSIQNTLSRIVSTNALIAYEKTNTLIISDSGYKVRRILDILELIDVQGQQPQVSIVPIRYADAKNVSERVNDILKANQSSGGAGQPFKISPDERSNSVIVFGPPRTIQDVTNLVKKFDIELDDPARQAAVHVRPLDYADAKKIATTLSALASGNKSGSSRRPPVSATPFINGGNAPQNANRPNNEAPDVAELNGDIKITSDDASNSLLVTGSRAAYQAVNSIVRKLDVRRSQVFVEADILDINVDSTFKFGTSIFGGAKQGDNNVITTWQAKDMAPVIVGQASATKDGTVSEATAGKVAGTFADDMNIGILSGKSVTLPGLGTFSPGALIKMIKSDSNTKVLSSPQILMTNNEESKFVVGQKIFFKSFDTNVTTGTPVPKIEKEDVDLTMNIKPNISNSNYVTLKVDLEQASIGNVDAGTNLPSINKRKSSQIVTAKNSQTIVISGLVETRQIEAFYKIPLLGDIPILGWLFRNSSIKNTKSNLVIFLTPHIVHGADDLAGIYQNKIKERDEFMEQVYGSGYKDDRFYALLPNEQDGAYSPDTVDEAEKKQREETLKSIRDDGFNTPKPSVDANSEGNQAKLEDPTKTTSKKTNEPVSVPANATVGGGSGGSFSSSGESSIGVPPPPPPPQGSPISVPVEGGDGVSPDDFPPPPPPPSDGDQ